MEDVKVSKADCTTSGSGQFKCPDSSQSSFFKHCSKTFKTSCILSCCNSCSVCNFKRASAKERYKTRGEKDRNKTCQRCFFCKSLSFCQTCSKCPQCCQRVGCRGETTDLLAKVARARCKPQGSLHFEGGLCPTVQNEAPLDTVSSHHKWLCKSGKKPGSVRGLSCTKRKVGSRKGGCTDLPVLLQPVVLGPKAQQKVETHFGPQPVKPLSPNKHIQDGNTGNHQGLLTKRGMGHVPGFQRRLLSYPHPSQIQKIPQVLFEQQGISVHSPSIRASHGYVGIYQGGKGGEIVGSDKGYKNPPVPRRLVAQSPVPGNLPTKYPDPLGPLPRIRLGGQLGEVRTGTPASVQFRRLPVRSPDGTGSTHVRALGDIKGETSLCKEQGLLHGQAVYVPHRPLDSHREASLVGSPPHETNSVASQAALACTGGPGKSDSGSPVPAPPSGLVVGRKECAARATSTCPALRSTSFYRRLKRRLGRSLRRGYSKRRLVRTRKSPPYKLSRAESSLSGPQEFRASLQGSGCSYSHGQHNCGCLHQQARRYEIRLSLCPPVETSGLVPSQRNSPEGKAHSGSPECDSGQTIQAQSGDSDRMVPVPTSVQSLVLQLGPPTGGPLCNPIQPQTSPVCVTGSGSGSLGCGRPQHTMGESGCLRFSSGLTAQSSDVEGNGSGVLKDGPNCPRLAQHALVLGSGQSVCANPLPAPTPQGSRDLASQWPSSQEPSQLKSTCVAPRASCIQEQGFTDEVAARIEAPQRSSTRAVYKSKWTVFIKWCDSHKVDFRSPSVSQIADFLLYLFKERKLQPSTIDGYRTAIADMVGNQEVNISKDENLTRLLDSFHRDKPKGRRGLPSWNLSLVLHQLTKPPFEPMRKASLKHLTFKTVFLLALGSGKRRSEIHAWLFKNIRHQENWSQVSFYPSPMFLSKNQLAKEGPASVAPVVIPALAPSLDKELKEDRSLCPVRALRYYLDRTKDLRKGKDLVFVSFRKSFEKDIVPATISSWIKQTVLLCYQVSDEDSHKLLQVKAHDVRAFAASKAFQGGVSLEQILSACHWKAHNTFTQFYLKDLAWADSDLYHLGPIVAAQQVHADK